MKLLGVVRALIVPVTPSSGSMRFVRTQQFLDEAIGVDSQRVEALLVERRTGIRPGAGNS